MMMTEKYQISQADYNRMLKDKEYFKEFMGWRAHFSSYPPAGYGQHHSRIFIENNKYYCSWEHSDNCD